MQVIVVWLFYYYIVFVVYVLVFVLEEWSSVVQYMVIDWVGVQVVGEFGGVVVVVLVIFDLVYVLCVVFQVGCSGEYQQVVVVQW